MTPTFRSDVYVQQPNGSRIAVNPHLCLAYDSAEELADGIQGITPFGPPLVISGPANAAWVKFGGNFSHSDQVAWLQWLDAGGDPGTKINAGVLADYLFRFPTGAYAMRCIKREYEIAAYDQGFGGLPGAF